MQEERLKNNIVLSKSFEFSKDILKFYDKLTEDKKFFIANQLAKSGTSIGANLNVILKILNSSIATLKRKEKSKTAPKYQ